MAFPKYRILSTERFVQLMMESNKNGERFCFILGSGASVESGIPSGNALETRWMNCIMGESSDWDTPPMNTDSVREIAQNLYEDHLIGQPFEQIEKAWRLVRDGKKRSIPSEYYFDIYKLRFFPSHRNGYRYLERIMEAREPSLGYRTLAKLMTDNNLNNLVITTNFDSLVEDALLLYSTKKPLVVGHEALAGFIKANIQRPIIAKVHRDLMYAPFNSPETTGNLKEEWRSTLNYVFTTYTPVVIGYAGGDRSLMSYLEEKDTAMCNGVYWCYWKEDGLPEERIQQFVLDKKGYFVETGGFDALLMALGTRLYPDEISPSGTDFYLKQQYNRRSARYTEQWDKLSKDAALRQTLKQVNTEEQFKEAQRDREDTLTARDYFQRGNRAFDEGDYPKAVCEYSEAIRLDFNYADAYNNRSNAYFKQEKYDLAIADCNRAIELNPNDATAYNSRGAAYHMQKKYDLAIADYTRAIELNPNHADAYNNRGYAYFKQEKYDLALADCNRAIELNPNHANAYNNRGYAYDEQEKYDLAIADYNRAIELNPNDANAYNNRGAAYHKQEKYDLAIADYTKAVELNPNDADAYNNRGIAYHKQKMHDLAIADYTRAIELNPNDANAYNNRGAAYRKQEKYDLAIADCNMAIELNPKRKWYYTNRAISYRAIGKTDLAKADERKAAELK